MFACKDGWKQIFSPRHSTLKGHDWLEELVRFRFTLMVPKVRGRG